MGAAMQEHAAPARDVLATVEEALGEPFGKLMFEGPEDDLKMTRNAQPALMTTALAVTRTLEDRLGAKIDHRAYGGGAFAGEYAALAAVGTLDVANGGKTAAVAR